MIQETDAVVIGAGPVGLFQVFQLGLQGITAHVIDALPHAGGQCVELYGDKPIYDIPGIPVCTGSELAGLLLQQIAPFKTQWHLNTLVSALTVQADGRLLVQTSQGAQLLARTVFIAAGVGAFVPRTLKVEGIERFVGTQVHYQHLPATAHVAGLHVVVHGGDEPAVARAVEQSKAAGAKRAVVLPMSVPAHSRLMRPAALRMAERIKTVNVRSPRVPVIHNVHLRAESDPEAIRNALVRQIESPVRWVELIQKMAADGVDRMIECGPGKVLAGLNKRIVKTFETLPVYDPTTLQAALEMVVK